MAQCTSPVRLGALTDCGAFKLILIGVSTNQCEILSVALGGDTLTIYLYSLKLFVYVGGSVCEFSVP